MKKEQQTYLRPAVLHCKEVHENIVSNPFLLFSYCPFPFTK